MSFLQKMELAYYISFIVLTILLVWYTARTYRLAAKRETNLYVRLVVPEEECCKYEQLIFLRIYNCGNSIAEKVSVSYKENQLCCLDYIKPNEEYSIVFGVVMRMIGCNRPVLQSYEIKQNDEVSVSISCKGSQSKEVVLDTSSLFVHSDVVGSDLHDLSESLKKIETHLNTERRGTTLVR